MDEYLCIAPDVILGEGVKLAKFINLYGCTVGDNTKIGAFVEIQKNAAVGKFCKVSSHTFICDGVSIGDNCFIGHGVMFINDNYPQATRPDGTLETEEDWKPRFVHTKIGNNVAIGSNATIKGGVTIGDSAIIGAGSVVTKDIPAGEIWAGVPARRLRKIPVDRKELLIKAEKPRPIRRPKTKARPKPKTRAKAGKAARKKPR